MRLIATAKAVRHKKTKYVQNFPLKPFFNVHPNSFKIISFKNCIILQLIQMSNIFRYLNFYGN